MPVHTLILGGIFILVGVLLKFYPQFLNTLSEKDRAKMDKKKLSRFLFISFTLLGLFLIAINFLGDISIIISIPVIFISVIFIAAYSKHYINRK